MRLKNFILDRRSCCMAGRNRLWEDAQAFLAHDSARRRESIVPKSLTSKYRSLQTTWLLLMMSMHDSTSATFFSLVHIFRTWMVFEAPMAFIHLWAVLVAVLKVFWRRFKVADYRMFSPRRTKSWITVRSGLFSVKCSNTIRSSKW